ncbi:MAG: hypothetical protein KY475_12325 [Planctomycetes bacterium]|nr:hypothetical protein [Planctomycetota bacterium]
MPEPVSADQIREQMSQVRRELGLSYGEAVENARDLANWRYYVRNYPWAALGAAAVIGYLVVPNRLEIVSPSAKELMKLADKNKLVVERQPPAETRGVSGALFTMMANLLVRGLISYAGQKLGKSTGRETAKAEEHAKAET